MSDCNEPDGITIAEYDEVSTPIVQRQTLLEVQQTDQDVGNQSRKMSVETLAEEISPQIQQYTDDAITELDSGIQGKIDESITAENIQGKIDASIAAAPSTGGLDIDSSKPTVQGWIDASIADENIQGKIDVSIAAIPPVTAPRTTILRDGETFTLPESAEIGENIELLVQQPVTRGFIQQVADTTLMFEDFYNPSGADGSVKTRNHQLLRLTYVSDELVEDHDYPYLPNLLDTPVNAGVSSVVLSPDGRYVGLGLNAAPWFTIYRIDGTQFRKVVDSSAGLFNKPPLAFAFNPENNDIHVGLSDAKVHMILSFDGSSLRFKSTIRQNKNAVTFSISFSPGGRYKAEGHSGGTVTITDLTTNTEVDHPIGVGSLDVIHSLSWSPKPPEGTDQLLAIGHFGSPCITFLALRDGAFIQLDPVRTIRHRSQAIKDLAWSTDGELLAAVVGSEVIVYNMIGDDRAVVKEITHKYPGGEFLSVAFSPRKHLAVSSGSSAGTQPGQVDLYDFSNNEAPGDNERLLTIAGLNGITDAKWTIGDGYFLIGTSTAPHLDTRHAAKYLQGVWEISALARVNVQNKDFSSFVSAR